MKSRLEPGTYVVGDPKYLLDDGVEPTAILPLENGQYKDQWDSKYEVDSGVLAIADAKIIKHPNILKNVLKSNGCCGRQVNGSWWMVGWTRQFTVLWSHREFEVSDDTPLGTIIGPITITRVDG